MHLDAADEPVSREPLEALQASKIFELYGRRRLYLDPRDPPQAVLEYKIYLVAVAITNMVAGDRGLSPPGLTEDLHGYKVLEAAQAAA